MSTLLPALLITLAILSVVPLSLAGEDDVCFLYSRKNTSGEPLISLKGSVKIFETRLIFQLPADKGITIQSIKLAKPSCTVILCDDKHLRGKCTEYTTTSLDLSKRGGVFTSVKSVDCACTDEPGSSLQEETVIKSEKLTVTSIKNCGSLYRDWHFHGIQNQLRFPGSVKEVDSQIRSIDIEDGCSVMVWGSNKDNASVSLSLSKSTSFFESPDSSNYEWACCSCDSNSEAVCRNAQALSLVRAPSLLSSSPRPGDRHEEFAEFTKYGKKIIGIGRNYRWNKTELAKALSVPTQPIVFLKPTTAYITEGHSIKLPDSLGPIFYELELGVVIGRKGRNIPQALALDYVAGYFLALDMTAKKFIKQSTSNQSLPWELGKGFDSACPVGSFIPKFLIPNPNEVHLECMVNGEVTQSDSTSNMIFDVQQLISFVSKYMTLEPYDTILTGTPDGFGAVKSGDVIEGRLGNLTTITFTVE